MAGRLSGCVMVKTVGGEPVIDDRNEVTNYGRTAFIQQLIGRNLDSLVWYVILGEGGDCSIDPGHGDTGARVPTDPVEIEIRKFVAEIPIQAIINNDDGSITFKALVRREQGNSPNINEFALYTRAGNMVAHFVTELDGVKARKYVKSELSFWIVEWTLTYEAA